MTHIIKPYGKQDPYASIELIAHSSLETNDKFTIDQMPVMSARVSHSDHGKTGDNPEGDAKLIKYLAEHKHFSVFEHQSATFRVTAPLFVWRQCPTIPNVLLLCMARLLWLVN